jgi:ankyrin repeat protein
MSVAKEERHVRFRASLERIMAMSPVGDGNRVPPRTDEGDTIEESTSEMEGLDSYSGRIPSALEEIFRAEPPRILVLLHGLPNISEKYGSPVHDPSMPDAMDGATLLHHAARLNRLDIAIRAIRLGADVNATTNRGLTPLHVACAVGHGVVMTGTLLAYGADPVRKSLYGITPLMMACHWRRNAQVIHLLKHLRDAHIEHIDAVTTDDRTALYIACRAGADDQLVCALLVMNANPIGVSASGRTTLHAAALARDAPALDAVLMKLSETAFSQEAGQMLEARDNKGRTCLHLALRSRSATCVKRILYYAEQWGVLGDIVNREDWWNVTPLMLAYAFGDVEIRAAIAASAVSISRRMVDSYGRTCLHYSAMADVPIDVALLASTWDKSSRDKDDYTPLHIACMAGNLEAIEQLVHAGFSLEPPPPVRSGEKPHPAPFQLARSIKVLEAFRDAVDHTYQIRVDIYAPLNIGGVAAPPLEAAKAALLAALPAIGAKMGASRVPQRINPVDASIIAMMKRR